MKTSPVARGFDARAERYDNPLTAFIGERELRQIRGCIPAGAEALDYGCGTGRTTLDLLKRGCKVTAFDFSTQMLAIAQIKAQRLGLEAEFTTEESALAGRAWPVVTCIGVLDYYPDPVPLLRTLKRYLQPGGRLVVTFPNLASLTGWTYWLSSRFTVPATPRTPGFACLAAGRAGLAVVEVRYAFPAIAPIGHTLVLRLEST